MEQPTGPGRPQSGGVQWDLAGMRTHASDIASAVAGPAEVVLNFGARHGADRLGGDVGVSLLQQVELRPLTARHLHDMLARLLAEEDAKANRPR
jgi:hypothetical protein